MKFCPNCGTPCEGANFCPGCGKDLRASSQAQPQVATPKKPMVVGYAQPTSQPTSQSSTQTSGTYDIATALAPFLVRINEDCKTYTITGVRDKGITEAIIPDCVIEIGEKAFDGCKKLANVQLPHSLTYIGPSAFSFCEALKKIIIPSNVKFSYCIFSYSGLEEVHLSEGIKTLGEWMFHGCRFEHIRLPSTLTTIDREAFVGCSRLRSIVIPSGVKEIGAQSFNNCTNLSEVTISEGVEKICDIAFSYCPSLKQITIPRSVKQIGNSGHYSGKVFSNCPNLAVAKVPQHLVQQFQTQCDPTCTIIPY